MGDVVEKAVEQQYVGHNGQPGDGPDEPQAQGDGHPPPVALVGGWHGPPTSRRTNQPRGGNRVSRSSSGTCLESRRPSGQRRPHRVTATPDRHPVRPMLLVPPRRARPPIAAFSSRKDCSIESSGKVTTGRVEIMTFRARTVFFTVRPLAFRPLRSDPWRSDPWRSDPWPYGLHRLGLFVVLRGRPGPSSLDSSGLAFPSGAPAVFGLRRFLTPMLSWLPVRDQPRQPRSELSRERIGEGSTRLMAALSAGSTSVSRNAPTLYSSATVAAVTRRPRASTLASFHRRAPAAVAASRHNAPVPPLTLLAAMGHAVAGEAPDDARDRPDRWPPPRPPVAPLQATRPFSATLVDLVAGLYAGARSMARVTGVISSVP